MDKFDRAQIVLAATVVLAVGLSLLLMGLRVSSAVSFAEPIHLQTSGAEYESLYSIWRYVHGMTVYTDRYQPPFNLVIFNWLFYESYGLFTKAVTELLGLGDAWIPTVARLFSFLAIAATGLVAFAAFRLVMVAETPAARLVAAGFALLLAFGPLTGFWVITVRPDNWAMAMEVAGAAWFIWRYPARHWQAVLGAALFSYLAWAFKQSNVSFLVAVGLFLLIRLAWRELIVIVAVIAAAFAITFAVGDAQYIKNILLIGYSLDYDIARGFYNLRSFAIKMLPGLAVLLSACIFAARAPGGFLALRDDPRKLFAVCGVAVAGALAVLTGFQSGGAENYYFTFAFFTVLSGLVLLPARLAWPIQAVYLVVVGWLALAVAVTAVVTGYVGMTSLKKHHDAYSKFTQCIAGLPHPIFIQNPYLSLPWMSGGERHFILSFIYHEERRRGHRFAGDGIGGMIERGELATLVFPGSSKTNRYDGASLGNFQEIETGCPALTVLVRRTGN